MRQQPCLRCYCCMHHIAARLPGTSTLMRKLLLVSQAPNPPLLCPAASPLAYLNHPCNEQVAATWMLKATLKTCSSFLAQTVCCYEFACLQAGPCTPAAAAG